MMAFENLSILISKCMKIFIDGPFFLERDHKVDQALKAIHKQELMETGKTGTVSMGSLQCCRYLTLFVWVCLSSVCCPSSASSSSQSLPSPSAPLLCSCLVTPHLGFSPPHLLSPPALHFLVSKVCISVQFWVKSAALFVCLCAKVFSTSSLLAPVFWFRCWTHLVTKLKNKKSYIKHFKMLCLRSLVGKVFKRDKNP